MNLREFRPNGSRAPVRGSKILVLVTALYLGSLLSSALAEDLFNEGSDLLTSSGAEVTWPNMNAANGRVLFATKGCVICHSINGVGGQAAPALDAHRLPALEDPFEFSARMWAGAPEMIALQKKDLGYQIQISGSDLADLFAFIHDEDEQQKFEIPGRSG